jgi:hypothetical protein
MQNKAAASKVDKKLCDTFALITKSPSISQYRNEPLLLILPDIASTTKSVFGFAVITMVFPFSVNKVSL